MAYIPLRTRVQQIVVDARVQGVQVLNVFHLTAEDHNDVDVGSSITLLSAFRGKYRSEVLPLMQPVYKVSSYSMEEIQDAQLVGVAPNQRWRTLFDATKREVLLGVAGTDEGTAIPSVDLLPLHESMRVFKRPATIARGYLKGNYWRFAPMITAGKSPTVAEIWTPGFQATWDAAMGGFVLSTYPDGGVAAINTWVLAVWSPSYWGRVLKPLPGTLGIWQAAPRILAALATPYVGTQVSRRFSPTGLQKGA